MKAIRLNIVINSIRSRKDRSVGFSAETPELTNDQRNVFFDLQGKNANILIEPEDGSTEVLEVKTDLENKSQAQRIRNTLYVLLEKRLARKPTKSEAIDNYYLQTEKIIQNIKNKIDEYVV